MRRRARGWQLLELEMRVTQVREIDFQVFPKKFPTVFVQKPASIEGQGLGFPLFFLRYLSKKMFIMIKERHSLKLN